MNKDDPLDAWEREGWVIVDPQELRRAVEIERAKWRARGFELRFEVISQKEIEWDARHGTLTIPESRLRN